ncbi:DUF2742 domain-containing protein [Gordonia amicalis]|uniref:DUF2742 domain-containing protein n=1 Tax=Gordonia amicalis TaxID=89053 RepID=A0AAE4R3M9_9ACTN|nr:DUF2742 domain-containing protein [Gordonia amicalis]MDV6310316.1 DUF2742 domain-containing protein [Gordonia amicalis]UKO91053.1 DUF2742 domain-containing protein [Gordonia amicalis]
MSDAYTEVRAYVQRIVGTHGGPAPAAGSPAWCDLADSDRAKMLAVLHAGTRAVLEDCVAAIDDRRRESKAAAVEVAQAEDWSAVARRVRNRDQALRSGAYVERRVSV